MAGYKFRSGGGEKGRIKIRYGEIKKPAMVKPFRYAAAEQGRYKARYGRIKWPYGCVYRFRYTTTERNTFAFTYPTETWKGYGIRYLFRVGILPQRQYHFDYGEGYGNLYIDKPEILLAPPARKSREERRTLCFPLLPGEIQQGIREMLLPIIIHGIGQKIKTIEFPFLIRETEKAETTEDFSLIIRETGKAYQTIEFSFIIREAFRAKPMIDFSLLIREIADAEKLQAFSFLIREAGKAQSMQDFSLLIREIASAESTKDFSFLIRELADAAKTKDFSFLIRELADAVKTWDFSFLIRELAGVEGTKEFSFLIRELASAVHTLDFSFLIRELQKAETTRDFSFLIRELASAESTKDFSFLIRELADAVKTLDFSFLIREAGKAETTEDFSFLIRELAGAEKTENFSFLIREMAALLPEWIFSFIIRETLQADSEKKYITVLKEINEERPVLLLPESEVEREETERYAEKILLKDGLMEDMEERNHGIIIREIINEWGKRLACGTTLADKKEEPLRLLKTVEEINRERPEQILMIPEKGTIIAEEKMLVRLSWAMMLLEETGIFFEKEREAWHEKEKGLHQELETRLDGEQWMEACKTIWLFDALLSGQPEKKTEVMDIDPVENKAKEGFEAIEDKRTDKALKDGRRDMEYFPLEKDMKEGETGSGLHQAEKSEKEAGDEETEKKFVRGIYRNGMMERTETRQELSEIEGKKEHFAGPLMRKDHETGEEEEMLFKRQLKKDGYHHEEHIFFADKLKKPAYAEEAEKKADKKKRRFDGYGERDGSPLLQPRVRDAVEEAIEEKNLLYRERQGNMEEALNALQSENRPAVPEEEEILSVPDREAFTEKLYQAEDKKEGHMEEANPTAKLPEESELEKAKRQLKLYQRFWVIGQSDYKDWIILPPHDFNYEDDPIIFDVQEREDYNQCVYPNEFYRRIDRHPIQSGENTGREETGVSTGIMVDVINIYIMMWFKFTPAFWGWTGVQAVTGMTDAIHEYLTLEKTVEKQRNKAVKKEYERAYQWLRWNAEAVVLQARDDRNLRGNYYVEVLLERLIDYMIDHHFDVMPVFHDVNKMDEWRALFERPVEKDIKWVIEKVKGIRHKLLDAKQYQEE